MNRFHRYDFEEGFEDEDPWWTPGTNRIESRASQGTPVLMIRYISDDRESPEHGQQRLGGFLAYLFLNRDETCKCRFASTTR
jgi:hypothetical protein